MGNPLRIVVIGQAKACEQLAEKLRRSIPDCSVLTARPSRALETHVADLSILCAEPPGPDVLRRARELRRQQRRVAVMFRAQASDGGVVLDLLLAGVAGFLSPDMRAEQLHEAVRKAATDGVAFSEPLLTLLVDHLRAQQPPKPDTLSEREHEVLALIARGHTYKHIAHVLSLSPFTVKNHVHNILRKLGVRTRMEAVTRMRPHRK